jgi:hypothetical protein
MVSIINVDLRTPILKNTVRRLAIERVNLMKGIILLEEDRNIMLDDRLGQSNVSRALHEHVVAWPWDGYGGS